MLQGILDAVLTAADLLALKENLRDDSQDDKEERRKAHERRKQISTVRNAGYVLRRVLK